MFSLGLDVSEIAMIVSLLDLGLVWVFICFFTFLVERWLLFWVVCFVFWFWVMFWAQIYLCWLFPVGFWIWLTCWMTVGLDYGLHCLLLLGWVPWYLVFASVNCWFLGLVACITDLLVFLSWFCGFGCLIDLVLVGSWLFTLFVIVLWC